MPDARNRDKSFTWQALIVLIISAVPYPALSQSGQDTLLKVSQGSLLSKKGFKSFISTDTVIRIPSSLSYSDKSGTTRAMVFYDSLRSKAYKSRLTRALYDLVIVSPSATKTSTESERSDMIYTGFSGFRIRNISVKRLDVFGTRIDNPGMYQPKKVEAIMNSTHVNTNEKIIRNYLLFREGDTISPLVLTDNERLLRQLPYIDDARIVVVPVSESEADIVVITKDLYSIGAELRVRNVGESGSVGIFEKNLAGLGHELKVEIPWSSESDDSPGVGISYTVKNIRKSFLNLSMNYYNALDIESYGLRLTRALVSSETKYAGNISISYMKTIEDLDTLPKPVPLEYTFQDIWGQRSFLIDRSTVTRIILGARYILNNIWERPEINPMEYLRLQKYQLFLGSVSISSQEYYKTSLVYNYGRTEDVPSGAMVKVTGGYEQNEFKNRYYIGTDLSSGNNIGNLGYLYASAGFGAFLRNDKAEQGVFTMKLDYFSNLVPLRNSLVRNFFSVNYTRGIARYSDEYLRIPRENGFSGFRNDSLRGGQRINLSYESVVFSPVNLAGFRFAFFGFADMDMLTGTHEYFRKGAVLTSIGLGIRIRNDNLIFNTFQIRFAYIPSPPLYSRISPVIVSGEQLLRPENFDPGPPAISVYR